MGWRFGTMPLQGRSVERASVSRCCGVESLLRLVRAIRPSVSVIEVVVLHVLQYVPMKACWPPSGVVLQTAGR